jgi:hypothetical protein
VDRHPNDLTTDEEIETALEEVRNAPEEPRIVEATYHPEPDLDLFVLKISDGRRLVIPREYIQALAGATPEQAADFTTAPIGSHIWWPQMDDGMHISGLLEHRYGNDKWMARLERRDVAA